MEITRKVPKQALLGLIRGPCEYVGEEAGSNMGIHAALLIGIKLIPEAGTKQRVSDLSERNWQFRNVTKKAGEQVSFGETALNFFNIKEQKYPEINRSFGLGEK